MRSSRIFWPVVVGVTLVALITACGEEEPTDNQQNQDQPSEVTCDATAECDESEVCADGVCTDELSTGEECAEDDASDEFDDFICLDEQWRAIDDLEGPSIESLTADPTTLASLESATLDGEINNPYGVELEYQWSIDDSDWQLDAGDGPQATVTAPAQAQGSAEVTLQVDDLWDNSATDSVTIDAADVEDCSFTSSPFGGGDGTEESPWTICTSQQLTTMQTAEGALDAHYELKANIEVDDTFPVLGERGDGFGGHFDGEGHNIVNLEIDHDGDHAGMFAEISEEGIIEDLGLYTANINGDEHTGAIAGVNYGHLSGVTVEGSTISGDERTGGIAGINQPAGIIDGAYVDSTVEGHSRTGGIVGLNHGEISDSAASRSISSDDIDVGGVAGGNSGPDAVVARSHSDGTVTGVRRVGGLLGMSEVEAAVYDSYSNSSVELVDDPRFGGGLVGRMWDGTLERSYATGSVSATEVTDLGGFVADSEPFDSESETVIDASYWDTETSGLSHSDGGEGLETSEFGDESSFDSWDFDDVWHIGEDSEGDERPLLVDSPLQ